MQCFSAKNPHPSAPSAPPDSPSFQVNSTHEDLREPCSTALLTFHFTWFHNVSHRLPVNHFVYFAFDIDPPKTVGIMVFFVFFFELTSGFSTQLTKHLTPALLTEEWQIGLKRNFDAAQERLKNRNFEADQARLNKHTVDPDSWIGYWNSLFSHKKRCEMCSNTFQKNDKHWVCVWTLKRLKQSCTLPLGRSFATNLVGSKVAATLSPSAWRKSRTFPAKRYCGVWRDHSGGTLHRFFSRETNCGHVRDMRWYDCINWHKHCFRQLEFRNAVGLAGSSLRTVGLVRGWNQSFGG